MCSICKRRAWDSRAVLILLFYALCGAICLGIFVQTKIEKDSYKEHLCTPSFITLTPCINSECSYMLMIGKTEFMTGKTEIGQFALSQLCENRNKCLYVINSPILCYLHRNVWTLNTLPDLQIALIALAVLNFIGIVFSFVIVLRGEILQ